MRQLLKVTFRLAQMSLYYLILADGKINNESTIPLLTEIIGQRRYNNRVATRLCSKTLTITMLGEEGFHSSQQVTSTLATILDLYQM